MLKLFNKAFILFLIFLIYSLFKRLYAMHVSKNLCGADNDTKN